MTPFKSDPSLYKVVDISGLSGMSGGYVEEFISAGDISFVKMVNKKEKCSIWPTMCILHDTSRGFNCPWDIM